MQIMRTRPFPLARDFDAFFPSAGRGWGDAAGGRGWMPRVDAFETDESLTVRYELAGFEVEDLEVTVEDGMLTVKGSRGFETPEGARSHRTEIATGSFTRSLRVGDSFDHDSVTAEFSNGLLEVTLAKRPEVLPRPIEITTV